MAQELTPFEVNSCAKIPMRRALLNYPLPAGIIVLEASALPLVGKVLFSMRR